MQQGKAASAAALAEQPGRDAGPAVPWGNGIGGGEQATLTRPASRAMDENTGAAAAAGAR